MLLMWKTERVIIIQRKKDKRENIRMEAIKETWERIIVLIKEEMKDAPFNSFIKPLEPVSIEKEKKLEENQAT